MNRKSFDPKAAYKESGFVSFCICILTVVGFLQTSDQFLHWFLISITLSGILIGIDAVDWFRGRLNIFDPVGILGLFGFHFFFLAPLLHVYWDEWMLYMIPPPDWRDWLGGMAFLNFLGLLAYRVSRNGFMGYKQKRSSQTVWHLDRQKFLIIVSFALLVTPVLQIRVYAQYGGILGYIQASTNLEERDAMPCMGLIFMISESFPILALMAFAVYGERKKFGKSWVILALVLLVFLYTENALWRVAWQS